MIVVIQCAASKAPTAGCLFSTTGTPVIFVAHPEAAPPDDRCLYQKPDDAHDAGISWRDWLLDYNEQPQNNFLGLLPAHRLYANPMYGRLVDRLGVENVYVLSAGWGLIRSDFLTPSYDITFSTNAETYKRRRKSDAYKDSRMLPDDPGDRVFFFGSLAYLPLFYRVTSTVKTEKTAFYNSSMVRSPAGYKLIRYHTRTKTNWHYECAKAFLDGAISIEM